jgi:hypothetical protein
MPPAKPPKPRTYRWLTIRDRYEWRCLPDRRHVLIVRRLIPDWEWLVCLGHERNVIARGDVADTAAAAANAVNPQKLPQTLALEAYHTHLGTPGFCPEPAKGQ